MSSSSLILATLLINLIKPKKMMETGVRRMLIINKGILINLLDASGLACAILFGKISPKIKTKMVMTMVEVTVARPSLCKMIILKAVAKTDATMLITLVPIKMVIME